MKEFSVALFVVFFWNDDAYAAARPACAPPIEIANVPIEHVEPNGMLVTNDGRAIKLEGILLPAGARDHAPQFLAQQALAELGTLAEGHLANFTAMAPKEDRYGRVRAQAFIAGDVVEPWLQRAMLSRGLARVSITPDRTECASVLYQAEAEARSKRVGLWTISAYAVRSATDVSLADLGTFQVVEGKPTNISVRGSRAYINFGADWRTDFTATIASEDMKSFHAKNIDPAVYYAGKNLRVRGIIELLNGPEIEIATPEQIEVLPDDRAQPKK